jgi:vacuolar protein sorting-associated protein 29
MYTIIQIRQGNSRPSGRNALLIAARQMDVDVLLWGGTHRFEAFEMEGRFFITNS